MIVTVPELYLFLNHLSIIACFVFKDSTSNILPTDVEGRLAGFGDFNNDKNVDIIVLSKGDTKVVAYLSTKGPSITLRNRTTLINGTEKITAISLNDYDGDSIMDVLVWIEPKKTVYVYLFDLNQQQKGSRLLVTKSAADQPFIFNDFGIMSADLLFIDGDNKLHFVNISEHEVHTRIWNEAKLDNMRPGSSHLFADINKDFIPDILFVLKNTLEPWINKAGAFEKQFGSSYDLPDGYSFSGQVTVADFDRDGTVDVIAVLKKGVSEEIWIHNSKGWKKVHVEWNQNLSVKFVGDKTLRVGDLNLDGFPDLVVVLQGNSQSFVGLLLNSPNPNTGSDYSRLFRLDAGLSLLFNHSDIDRATFFDLMEDGILDVVFSYKKNSEYYVIAFSQTLLEDACFLKVLVTNGLDWSHGTKELYGVNQPGPTVSYRTDGIAGDQECAGTQLSQSSHFALQSPFVHFGLGQTPNFIDSLTVGMPSSGSKTPKNTWNQIIPNSQLVVIPNPIRMPSKWQLKLFLTPSKLVYITGGVLAGIMGVVAVIVAVLYWRDRKEDLQEKRQEAHKFHFDAM